MITGNQFKLINQKIHLLLNNKMTSSYITIYFLKFQQRFKLSSNRKQNINIRLNYVYVFVFNYISIKHREAINYLITIKWGLAFEIYLGLIFIQKFICTSFC